MVLQLKNNIHTF